MNVQPLNDATSKASLVAAAMAGTLDDLQRLYTPGTANRLMFNGASLLSFAIADHNPVQRGEKARFLLDEGADATWRSIRYGYNLVHVLFGSMRGNAPIPGSDLVLLVRLLEAGANPNDQDVQDGTPLQDLAARAITYSERSLEPVYQVMFSRDGLDLFQCRAFNHTLFELAFDYQELLPVLWGFTESYASACEAPMSGRALSESASKPAAAKATSETVWLLKLNGDCVLQRRNPQQPSERPGWDMAPRKGFEYDRLLDCYLNHEISEEHFLTQYRDPNNYEIQDAQRVKARADLIPE